MLDDRRQILDQIRAGPALFTGLPGDEVDLDRLTAHLAGRRFDGGIYATDGALEGILWVQGGAAGETWFFEESGPEAVLPAASGRELLSEIARRGGLISVFLRALPEMTMTGTDPAAAPPAGPPTMAPSDHQPTVPPAQGSPAAEGAVEDVEAEPLAPDADAPAVTMEPPADAGAEVVAEDREPSARPWPAILAEVSRRLVRQRGPRMGGMFAHALARALSARGGRLDGEEIIAPLLPESVWRQIVEEGSAPVVGIAGRAFVDRMIAAAEQATGEPEGRTT